VQNIDKANMWFGRYFQYCRELWAPYKTWEYGYWYNYTRI